MGAEKGCALLRDYMAHYENTPYELPDGTLYSDTNVLLLTRMLEQKGFVRDGQYHEIDGIAVYPRTWFSPYDYINSISYITEDSHAIHHFAQLWLPRRTRIKTTLKRKAFKLIGGERIKRWLRR